ncbi:GWxTD domain-containing protein [candidate division KSB1 bacterium]
MKIRKKGLGLMVLILMFIFHLNINAQVVQESSKGRVLNFYYDYASYKGSDNKSVLEFYYQISNDVVTFTKTDEGFSGKYELAVSFYDNETDRLVEYKNWEEQLSVNNYKETTLQSEFWINQMNFNLNPGEYKMKIQLNDVETDHKNDFSTDIVINNYENGRRILLSDIELVCSKLKDEVNPRFKKSDNLNLVPNATTVFGDLLPELNVYYELYNLPFETDEDGLLTVEYRIVNYRGEIIFSFFEDLKFDALSTTQFAAIPLESISEGKYYLEVRIRTNSNEKFVSKEKRFFVKRSFGPIGEDIEKKITYLKYIAKSSEIKKMEKADPAEKRKLWLSFWKEKDPTPNTPENESMQEYYRRIRYSNEKFSHTKEGWISDRGRIYIKLGKADEITSNFLYGAIQDDTQKDGFRDNIGGLDDRTFMSDQSLGLHGSKPCIIWYYYSLKKKFVFVDKHGTGDYILINQRADW